MPEGQGGQQFRLLRQLDHLLHRRKLQHAYQQMGRRLGVNATRYDWTLLDEVIAAIIGASPMLVSDSTEHPWPERQWPLRDRRKKVATVVSVDTRKRPAK